MRSSGFYWVFTGFYRVLPGFTGFDKVLFVFNGFLPGFTGFYWVLPGLTSFKSDSIGLNEVLPGFTGLLSGLPGRRPFVPSFTEFPSTGTGSFNGTTKKKCKIKRKR